jgi:osmotically-inducible protein OsmY
MSNAALVHRESPILHVVSTAPVVSRWAPGKERADGGPEEVPSVGLENGVVTLEGDVADIRTKKLVLQTLANAPGVDRLIDRLRVASAIEMSDVDVRDWLVDALLDEPSFANCAIDVVEAGDLSTLRPPWSIADVALRVRISVTDGVVRLVGAVPTRNHARLANALAWWVPGTRDVQERLQVRLPEVSADRAITDGLAIILEKDVLLDSRRISVRVVGGRAILTGVVRSAIERCAAESDAWAVPEISAVVNRLRIDAEA